MRENVYDNDKVAEQLLYIFVNDHERFSPNDIQTKAANYIKWSDKAARITDLHKMEYILVQAKGDF